MIKYFYNKVCKNIPKKVDRAFRKKDNYKCPFSENLDGLFQKHSFFHFSLYDALNTKKITKKMAA